jgi:hypothetical protein
VCQAPCLTVVTATPPRERYEGPSIGTTMAFHSSVSVFRTSYCDSVQRNQSFPMASCGEHNDGPITTALIHAPSRQVSWKSRALSRQWRRVCLLGSKNAVVHVARRPSYQNVQHAKQSWQSTVNRDWLVGSVAFRVSSGPPELRLSSFGPVPPSQSLANLTCLILIPSWRRRAYLQERSPTIWI